MGELGTIVQAPEELVAPVNVPAEAYVSPTTLAPKWASCGCREDAGRTSSGRQLHHVRHRPRFGHHRSV